MASWCLFTYASEITYMGGPLGNKKEASGNTCYNTDKPQKHHREKKPDAKDHMLQDPIYMNVQKTHIYGDRR